MTARKPRNTIARRLLIGVAAAATTTSITTPAISANAADTAPISVADNAKHGYGMPKIGWVEDGAYAATDGKSSYIRMPPTWAINAGMRDVMLNVGIAELITIDRYGRTKANASALDKMLTPVLTWNKANPTKALTVHVRLHVGERVPDYWRYAAGDVVMTDSKWKKNAVVPAWWRGMYGNMYEDAWRVLGPVFDGRKVIGSVNNPMGALFYPEPFLLFGSDTAANGVTNTQRLVQAGWSPSAQRNAMMREVRTPARYTKRVVIYLDINPTTFPTEKSYDSSFMGKLADTHIASYPKGRSGIENYSMRLAYLTGTGNYQSMLKGMSARASKTWTSEQLARPKVIGGDLSNTKTVWPQVTDYWESLGDHAVETTGTNAADGRANVWTESYITRQDVMARQDKAFAANATPRS